MTLSFETVHYQLSPTVPSVMPSVVVLARTECLLEPNGSFSLLGIPGHVPSHSVPFSLVLPASVVLLIF